MTAPEPTQDSAQSGIEYLKSLDADSLHTVQPSLFGWIVIAAVFFSYQIVGSIVTYLITGGDTAANITATRLLTMVSQVVFLLAPALLLVKIQPWSYRRLLRLTWPGWAQTGLAVLAVLALQFPIQGYMFLQKSFLEFLLPEGLFSVFQQYEQSLTDMYSLLATAHSIPELAFVTLVIVLTPAICEELLFRGVIFGSFRRSTSIGWAIAISAAVFSMFHLNPTTLIPLFGLGALLAYFTYKSGSILPAIIAHVTNNAIAIISLYFVGDADASFAGSGSAELGYVLLIASILSALVFIGILAMFKAVSRSESQG